MSVAGWPVCRRGNRDVAETVAGDQRLLDRQRSVHGPEITLERAAMLARTGDELCRGLFRDAGIAAGRVAGTICNVVNPELVVVGGELIVGGEVLVHAVREGLAQTSIPAVRGDVRVVASTLGDRAELLGAIGLAIAEANIAAVAQAA